jgi:prevent-host-death family protein
VSYQAYIPQISYLLFLLAGRIVVVVWTPREDGRHTQLRGRLPCSTEACYIFPMSRTISLREANQAFARCVREVEAGEEFVITRNGRPVARLVPVAGARVLTPAQEAALARTLVRLDKGWPIGAGPLDRAALHERG